MAMTNDGNFDDSSCACGPSGGSAPPLPAPKVNRPGLPAIAYRIGDHAAFRAALLNRLGGTDFPALADLTTAAPDDFTIAFCDAFATVADVLTFYQERLVNESYLRTATQRRSLQELAALIGYRLAPGVAAATQLAFTLETAPGAPAQAARPVTIPAGTRVQSVPDASQISQTFETVAPIDARADWNALAPTRSEPLAFGAGTTSLFLAGTTANVAVGDVILILGEELLQESPQDPTRDTTNDRWAARLVTKVAVDQSRGVTQISWASSGLTAQLGRRFDTGAAPAPPVRVYAMRQRASFFGYNAPEARLIARAPDPPNKSGPSNLGDLFDSNNEWAGFDTLGPTIQLDAVYPAIVPGSWVVLTFGDPITSLTALVPADTVATITRSAFALSSRITEISPIDGIPGGFRRRSTLVLAQSEPLPLAGRPTAAPVYGQMLSLDGAAATGLAPGRVIAISGKRQRVLVDPAPIAASPFGGDLSFNDRPGRVPVRGESFVVLAPPNVATENDPVDPAKCDPGDPAFTLTLPLVWTVRDHDGTPATLTATQDLLHIEPAHKEDDVVTELRVVAAIEPAVDGGAASVTLKLDAPIATCFDRATVIVNANVAPATHGETVSEVLGSGDGAQPNQSFALKQGPLTYVPSATDPSGRRSTLQVSAGPLLFSEVQTLADSGPRDRVFEVSQDDNGASTVAFGDGVQGARVPAGSSNVRATYRKGLGAAGNLRAGQLTTLVSRPLGVKAVTNPAGAAGGQDPESIDDARANASLRVMTLDRAVALSDYADFARTFAGIAKAQATLVAAGQRRVYVTVAAVGGAALAPDDPIVKNLTEALRRFGDPRLPIIVQSYVPVTFGLTVALKIAGDVDAAATRTAVEAALRAAYAFDARALGQAVALAEVYALIQAVPGVVAANVTDLFRTAAGSSPDGPPLALPAALATVTAGGVVTAAELLTLDAEPLAFGEMP